MIKFVNFPLQVLRSRIGERKLSKTNTDGVVDFLRTLPKETVVDFRLFRLQNTKDTSRFS